uniref:6-phosphofructo-2-kinase domain-containing protein n=1 Tax=Hyaloperonospora arabidopsidis (strain Emoy2) TaxID=559515 RepID=M4BXK5_HYAAE
MKLHLPSLPSTSDHSWSVALALALALQMVLYREKLQDAMRDGCKRLLVFKTMHRRFANQRLKRLNSLGDDRKSQWMWTKGAQDGSSVTSDSSEANADDGSSGTDGLITSQKKLVLVMVGLPARGKSFVVHKTLRYIEWMGFPTRMFNVGDVRRQLGKTGEGATFFSPSNSNAKRLREEMAMAALDDLLDWIETHGHVAVFDATNTTKLRRAFATTRSCWRPTTVEVALSDFRQRVQEYEKVYETVEDTEDGGNACYVKVYNAGEKIQARYCQGFLQSHIVSLLQNIHLKPRRIWLVRSGPSVTSCNGILGLDSELSAEGHRVARAITRFVEKLELERPMEVWTSPMKRSRETAAYLPTHNLKRFVTTTLLTELGGGDFEGLKYEEIERFYPKHYNARLQDKLRYRYPGVGGESYVDVISRLRSLIVEFERKKRDVLVICSESIQRCLMGYFSGCEAAKVPYLESYEHMVIELKPHQDGCDIKLIPLEFKEDAVESVTTVG